MEHVVERKGNLLQISAELSHCQDLTREDIETKYVTKPKRGQLPLNMSWKEKWTKTDPQRQLSIARVQAVPLRGPHDRGNWDRARNQTWQGSVKKSRREWTTRTTEFVDEVPATFGAAWSCAGRWPSSPGSAYWRAATRRRRQQPVGARRGSVNAASWRRGQRRRRPPSVASCSPSPCLQPSCSGHERREAWQSFQLWMLAKGVNGWNNFDRLQILLFGYDKYFVGWDRASVSLALKYL